MPAYAQLFTWFVSAHCICCLGVGCRSLNAASSSGSTSAVPSDSSIDAVERDDVASSAEARSKTQMRIDRLSQRVSGIRGLRILNGVVGKSIDRETLLRQLGVQVRSQVPDEAVMGESAFLKSFGFIPGDFDYLAQTLRLMESQLAGYYDPDQKTLFLVSDVGVNAEDSVIAHEVVHAITDQHFDIGSRIKYRRDASDSLGAYHALIEGDATSAMLDFSFGVFGMKAYDIADNTLRSVMESGTLSDVNIRSIPRIMRESLVSSYTDGVLFVHALRRRGGWAEVDRAYQDPPSTTEQLLHIDKYYAREMAEVIPSLADPAGEGWVRIHGDVYGEQGVRIAFEEWMSRVDAAKAAAGWAGDRAGVWNNSSLGLTVAAWLIRFDWSGSDGSGEAREAFNLASGAWGRSSLAKRSGSRSLCRKIGKDKFAFIETRAREVVLTSGAAPSVEGDGLQASAAKCSWMEAWASAILSNSL